MQGLTQAVTRLALMGLVMAAVLVTATALGLPAAAVLGLSITLAGLAGMVGLARRGGLDARIELAPGEAAVAAMWKATANEVRSGAAGAPVVEFRPATRKTVDPDVDPVMAAMAPEPFVDPELLMPRWRRPSLLAARRADPLRTERPERMPMRFSPVVEMGTNRRVVRYAVVQLLDRPDEVLGIQLVDLMAGDEVEVLQATGPFWEVACPDGFRGWVHRTTLGPVPAETHGYARRVAEEPDDLLTAVLSARGIQ